jgi:hypothetical protein
MNLKPDIQNIIYLILSGEAPMTELITNLHVQRLNRSEIDLLNAISTDKKAVTNRKKHCLAYLYMRSTDRLLFPEKKEQLMQWINEILANRMVTV